MFAANAVRRAAVAAVKREGSKRNASAYCDVVAAPPINKISSAEQLVHATLLTVGILGYPVYCMFDVASQKRAEFETYEIPEEWQRWRENQKKK